jgi:hypothetical protein
MHNLLVRRPNYTSVSLTQRRHFKKREIMKLMNFASVLLMSTAIIQPSHAQTSESAIVQAMKRIGSDWQALANSSDVLVVACPDSNFRGIRIIRDARRILSVHLPKLLH